MNLSSPLPALGVSSIRDVHQVLKIPIMQFQFVDNANIDVQTRKQIRSQVMQGKNTGKKRERIRYERKKLAVLTSKPVHPSTRQIDKTVDEQVNKKSKGIQSEHWQIDDLVASEEELVEWAVTKATTYRYWNDYSMYKYPRELEVEMRRALHFWEYLHNTTSRSISS
jgi:hypothetical protein